MIELKNEDLKKYVTFKVGGKAKNFYIPESIEEILYLTKKLETNYKILAGGSNILINDTKSFENIIYLRYMDESITSIGNGRYIVGASVKIQKLIYSIQEEGYGGIEYLISLPATVGGIVAMNAGRGEGWNMNVSDFIESVNVIRDGKIITVPKDECKFGYRTSIFKGSNDIILSAIFCFEKIEWFESKKRIEERIQFAGMSQDRSCPNFGSVYCKCNTRIMEIVRLIGLGNPKKIHFSRKTKNWLVNEGEGKFQEAIFLIKFVKFIHKILGKECSIEVQIWS